MPTAAQLPPLFSRPVPQEAAYEDRLRAELDLIDKFQFARVFLQVQKIMEILRQLDVPHIIRGSSGSSLVCYLLGITDIDPIQHGLHLARFMNNGRTDIPDIDIDVPYNRRDEIYRAICETWPNEVARISNHVTYGHKTAVREVAGAVVADDAAKRKALRKKFFKLETIVEDEEERKEVLKEAKQLVGKTRYDSLHCGGIVIFEEEGEVPEDLILKDRGYIAQIKLDKDETEDAGFIKIDVLSNRGLAQLREAQVLSGRGPQDILSYPLGDAAVVDLFRRGDTVGLTFGESRGMRRIFMEMCPRTLEDVAIALALIRPAAAADGRKAEFLDRWKRRAAAPDAALRPIVFDDDAIARIQTLLGCGPAEADRWRKVFAKGRADDMARFRVKLFLRGHTKDVVDRTMSDLEQLVHYSFCKSHAISYAQLVWALATERVYRPHSFWVATLNHNHSMYRKWVHWREARASGLRLTRAPGPWTLRVGPDGTAQMVGSAPVAPRQMKLGVARGHQDLEDFRALGFWLSEAFLPGCGTWPGSKPGLTKFRGPVACGRILRRDATTTLLTVGVGNATYIDMAIPRQARGDLFRWPIVEGEVKMDGGDLLHVKTIRGVTWKEMEGFASGMPIIPTNK